MIRVSVIAIPICEEVLKREVQWLMLGAKNRDKNWGYENFTRGFTTFYHNCAALICTFLPVLNYDTWLAIQPFTLRIRVHFGRHFLLFS